MKAHSKQSSSGTSRSVLVAVLLGLSIGNPALAQDLPVPETAPVPSNDSPQVPDNAANADRAADAVPDDAAPPMPGETPAVTRSDGEILQVLKVLSEAEISQAELALDEASSQQIKDSAQQIIADHADTIEMIDSLVVAGGISLVESPLSTELMERTEASTGSLEALSGTAFECTWLEQEVDESQLARETVDYHLLPFARSVKVRDLLSQHSVRLEQYAMEARQAQESLSQCG